MRYILALLLLASLPLLLSTSFPTHIRRIQSRDGQLQAEVLICSGWINKVILVADCKNVNKLCKRDYLNDSELTNAIQLIGGTRIGTDETTSKFDEEPVFEIVYPVNFNRHAHKSFHLLVCTGRSSNNETYVSKAITITNVIKRGWTYRDMQVEIVAAIWWAFILFPFVIGVAIIVWFARRSSSRRKAATS